MPGPVSNERAAATTPSRATTKPAFTGVTVSKNEWGNQLEVKVPRGSNLTRMAANAGTDVDSLVNLNWIEDKNKIAAGQVLQLPTTFHTVKSGDTFWGIAHNLGIDHKLLMELNNAKTPDLNIGQELRVPAVNTPETEKVRGEMKELVADAAKADGKIWFGEESFRPHSSGNTLGYFGPVETDVQYQVSDDFKTVHMMDRSGETDFNPDAKPTVVNLKDPVADFRKLLSTEAVGNIANAYVTAKCEAGARYEDFKVNGPTKGAHGAIGFEIKGKKETRTISWDPKSGAASIDGKAAGNIGTRPSEVTANLARLLQLKLPLYAE
jgi:LysM repeat protein